MKKIFFALALLTSLFANANRWYPGVWADGGMVLDQSSYPVPAGDTIVLRNTDVRTYFALLNFTGQSGKEIVVINEGGRVQLGAISFEGCVHMKLMGTGAPGVTYGFYFLGTHDESPAVNITKRSAFIETAYWETYLHG